MKKNISSSDFFDGPTSVSKMTGANSQKVLPVYENSNYISQNENTYYGNNKVFFKPIASKEAAISKYYFSTPGYLRILDKYDQN